MEASMEVNNASVFNMTLEEYLIELRGPKHLPLEIGIPVTIVYILIFLTGVVGNVLVCVVIVKHPSMHTATNYYLFSLSISDLMLLLLGLPNDLSIFWHQYPSILGLGLCKIRGLLSEAASYVSVLIIVVFSTERYLAVCHPLHVYTMSGLQRAVRIIAAMWVVSLVSALPFAVITRMYYVDYPPGSGQFVAESAFCGILHEPTGLPLWELSTLLFFVIPMLIILVLYIRMGLAIRSRTPHSIGKDIKGSVQGEMRQSQSKRAIIRMLAAVVIAFFICWAPFHAQRLLFIYGRELKNYKYINEWMFYITGLLYYVSSTVNPILYNLMSNRYRVAFREILCGRKKRKWGMREHSSLRDTTTSTTLESDKLSNRDSLYLKSIRNSSKMHSNNFKHKTNSMEEQRSTENFTDKKDCINSSENLVLILPARTDN